MFISTFQVKFKREIFFKDNEGTALHLSSASVNLTKGSLVHFEGNYGKYGGAVNMIALSVIHVYDECTLNFINNTSVSKGGAFYVHSLDQQHEASFSHSCFMQYRGHTEENTDRNITFLFQNNSALSGLGNVLFAISLLPCDHARHEKRTIFDNIGNVSHQNEGVSGLDITTLVNDFEFSEGTLEQMQHLIPGIEFDMNITSIDELHHNRSSVFNAHMTSREDANITIDPANTLVSNNIINVHGNKIGRVGTLTLETEIASISIKIGLGECPPGYLNDGGSCVCSPSRFLGVARCENSTTFIFRGYWIGLYDQGKFCSAHCPLRFCSYNQSRLEEIQLPSNVSNIDYFICGPYRTGTLCGQCINGSSVYYHSHTYQCKPNKYCKMGILFYFLSEVIPLMIFFLIVLSFNISFTSGELNGFILFAQMSDSLDISAGGSIDFPVELDIASYPYKFIYRVFNFDFFSYDALSFCLWENATTLDALVMKFLTITFALILITLIVFVFNSWKFKIWCHCCRPQTLRAAFTHGLATLLIASFSQCARVSFLVLSPTWLQMVNHKSIPVVFYSGNLQPFEGRHLQYALPALFFLFVLVVLPLLWLLSYPVLFKLLGNCHVSESKLAVCLLRLFPIELLDCFQSCFKDDCCHFAGLYLVYRLIPLIIFASAGRLLDFHTLVAVQFLIMFSLHSAVNPYKIKWHNIIDSLVLADLSLVNIITTYNYAVLSTGDEVLLRERTRWTLYIQILLMYLPLTYILYYSTKEIYFKVKMKCKGYSKVNSEENCLLPPLRNF